MRAPKMPPEGPEFDQWVRGSLNENPNPSPRLGSLNTARAKAWQRQLSSMRWLTLGLYGAGSLLVSVSVMEAMGVPLWVNAVLNATVGGASLGLAWLAGAWRR
jgi:hypothetical protein